MVLHITVIELVIALATLAVAALMVWLIAWRPAHPLAVAALAAIPALLGAAGMMFRREVVAEIVAEAGAYADAEMIELELEAAASPLYVGIVGTIVLLGVLMVTYQTVAARRPKRKARAALSNQDFDHISE